MRRLLGIVLLLGLAGCGGGNEADIPAIENKIEGHHREQTGQRIAVDCPSRIEWQTGEEFHCFAEKGQQTARITVSMENDDGEWSYTFD